MLTDTKTYPQLVQHSQSLNQTNLGQLFDEDTSRSTSFTLTVDGLHMDYSRNLITDHTLKLLIELAEDTNINQAIQDMFAGKLINTTEHRAALHIALRNTANDPILIANKNVMPQINAALDKMYSFAETIRSAKHLGYTGKPIKNIINIGIGGSSLGPEMAYEALKFYSQRDLQFRFISNVDPADFYEKTLDLNPEETLFIVSSKTFTTEETMSNAQAAKDWILSVMHDQPAVAQHFVAVSTNASAVKDFGINEANMFEFWDWVGGRYSLLSSIGLSLAIAIGKDNFEQLRLGAHSIDQHFLNAPLAKNIPVLLGLLNVWYRNFWGFSTEAVLPYSQYLHRLPAYLQQASMESNGKSVDKQGQPLNYDTAPILWGEPGTNGQHSFHQLLHQGTQTVPVDLIGFRQSCIPDNQSLCDIGDQQAKLNRNMVAQAEALAFGQDSNQLTAAGIDNDLIPHKTVIGNKPSTILIADKLTPFSLGQIIATYEHKIFVAGHIWGVNSFDQFGVELGKQIAKSIGSGNYHHASSESIINKLLPIKD